MAHRIRTAGLVLVLVASFWAMASAQSSGCTNTLISLSPCLNYIQGNSSTPSSGCCSQLSNVVNSQPQCLCEALNGGSSSLGININQTQALALPGACKVQTPPLSQCNGEKMRMQFLCDSQWKSSVKTFSIGNRHLMSYSNVILLKILCWLVQYRLWQPLLQPALLQEQQILQIHLQVKK